MAAPLPVDTLHLSVRELSERIRNKELSPVALAGAYLERLESLGPHLGAVVTVTRDVALAEARRAEREIAAGRWRGPLHGIPYGVKDLLATKGIPTTWGAEPYRNQVFDHDATVVARLREAGAVLLGKLSMVELAGGLGYNSADASFTGPGRTPWNVKYWSGGSSSGPGAATAAALVAFSIGSETSGSIITPAAFSGVAGLRPTYGRVSRHGAMALCWTLDKLGPMARTAEDCGLVMAAIAGRDPLDPTSVDRPWSVRPAAERRWRIGVLKESATKAQPEVKRNFETSVGVLRGFCEVADDVEFPDFPYGPAVSTIVQAEGASAFRDLIESGATQTLRQANDTWGGFAASVVSAVDYLQAMRLRGPMKRALDALYASYDALVAPSRQTVSYPIGVDFDKAYPNVGGGPAVIPAGNLAGQPALSVLNGFGAEGLPTGFQLTGRAFADETLVAIAAEYQRRTDWHTMRPPV
ncbi:MAG TPA: amidase [Thermoanaerobaculia bacterium]|nr:amidase [Thermoanaerobaculia bacterium]